ncbi:putative tubby-like protein [Helianthus annuus]|nr:putative tubby-like protein [Helianthus annuus]
MSILTKVFRNNPYKSLTPIQIYPVSRTMTSPTASPCYSSDDDWSRRGTPDRVFKEPEYPIAVVDQKYCSNCAIQLMFEKDNKVEDKFKISDDDGNIVFKARKKKSGYRVMVDESDQPVVSFTSKVIYFYSFIEHYILKVLLLVLPVETGAKRTDPTRSPEN